jgi:hypothetical protein
MLNDVNRENGFSFKILHFLCRFKRNAYFCQQNYRITRMNTNNSKSKTPWGLIAGIGCGAMAFVTVIIVVVVCGYWGVRISSPDKEDVEPESEWTTYEWNGKEVEFQGPTDSLGRPHGKVKMRIPEFDGKGLYDGTFVHGVMEGKNVIYYGVTWNFEGEARNNDFYKGKWVSNGTFYPEDFYFKGTFRDMRPYNGTWYLQGKKRGETVNGESSPDDLFM